MRLGTAALILPLFFAGCATTPVVPLPSKAAFSEQVLVSLADKRGNEIIDELKTKATQGSGVPWAVLGTFLGHPLIGAGAQAIESTSNEQKAVRLENQRAQLKAKLLTIYESRIQATDDYFAVCSQGKERRYQRAAGFPRLDDGPGPCPTTQISLND